MRKPPNTVLWALRSSGWENTIFDRRASSIQMEPGGKMRWLNAIFFMSMVFTNKSWMSFCSNALGSAVNSDFLWVSLRRFLRAAIKNYLFYSRILKLYIKSHTFTTSKYNLFLFVCWNQRIDHQCFGISGVPWGHQKQSSGQLAPFVVAHLLQPNHNLNRWSSHPADMTRQSNVWIALQFLIIPCINYDKIDDVKHLPWE